MVDKTPAQITPGSANRGSVVHASDASLSDLSRSHTEEDISRLQSAVIAYNATLTYEIGDFVEESGDVYRNIVAIAVPEAFNAAKWELVPIPQTPWESDIDGATFNLENSGYLEQNEITEPADPTAGLLRLWSEEESGFSLLKYKGNNGLVNTISQDVFVSVRNISGVTILKNKVVHVTGAQGQRVTVELARADSDSTMRGIGFVIEDIANNSNGFVLVAGTERNVNTNAFSAGDTLYVSETTAGEVTTTPPSHPNISQVIGFILVSNPTTGEINVIPGDTNGQEEGTNKNSFLIGDGLVGAKSVDFTNDFTGILSWNPTAARTQTLQDQDGTIANLTDIIAQTPWLSDINGAGFDLNDAANIFLSSLNVMEYAMFNSDVTLFTSGASGNAMGISTLSNPRIVTTGFSGGADPSTQASATITSSSVIVGDSVTIDGKLYTGVTGVKTNFTEFSVDGTDTQVAVDLTDSINQDSRIGTLGIVSASSIGPVITLLAAVPFTLGRLDFSARRNGGGNFTYCKIENVVYDNLNGTANSQTTFQNRSNDSLSVFYEINPSDSIGVNRFYFPVNIHQTNLTFDNSLSLPGNNVKTIYTTADDMVLNMPSNDGFSLRSNNVELSNFSVNGLDITNLNLLMDGGYIELTEIAEPTAPAADKAKLWLDPSVIINDHPRLALTDENGVVFDLSSAGIIVNTYNTEAIGNNHYLALSGLNTSNLNFINRAIVLPRSSRFYNMYVVVTTNSTTINTTCTLVDAADSPTVLEVDIPIGTTGTFFNTDDFVDLEIGTEIAYQFSATTGGTLSIASVGLATDILRLVN